MSIQVAFKKPRSAYLAATQAAEQPFLPVETMTPPLPAADELLWKAFKAGSKEAYAAIYVQYFRTLFKYGKKITPDEDVVQDCIQDLFIDLLKSRERLGDTTSIKYYLFRSLRRKIALVLTKRGNRPDATENEWNDLPEYIYADSHEHELIAEQALLEQKTEILNALTRLTKSQQQAIKLRFYDNLSYAEVAAAMSIHVDSAYNLISKGTALLRKNVRKIYTLLLAALLMA